jgi:hypothetical protein
MACEETCDTVAPKSDAQNLDRWFLGSSVKVLKDLGGAAEAGQQDGLESAAKVGAQAS